MSDLFAQVYEATKTTYAEVWNDLDKVQWIASHFIHLATNEILEENYRDARIDAMSSFFFEQWATLMVHENGTQTCNWGSFVTLCDWTKMSELYDGDEHTLVSFCRKRIPCKCLDKKYKEVKWITKIGFCCYEDCTLPGNKTGCTQQDVILQSVPQCKLLFQRMPSGPLAVSQRNLRRCCKYADCTKVKTEEVGDLSLSIVMSPIRIRLIGFCEG